MLFFGCNNKIFLVLNMSLIFLFFGCAKTQEQKELKNVDNNINIRIEGVVYPVREQKIFVSVSGYVKQIYVRNGDKVHKGDLIYRIDKKLLNLKVQQIREEIVSLQKIRLRAVQGLSMDGSISAVNLAARELKKMAYLKSKGYVNTFEENNYKKNYINAMFENRANKNNNFDKIEKLNTEIMSKKIELKSLQYKIDHADVHALINGFVTKLNLSVGEFLNEDFPVCNIVNLDNVIVKAGFAVGLLPYIQVGQKVRVNFVTTPPYHIYTKIAKINPIVNPKFDRMTIDIKVPNKNYILQQGVRTLVTIPLTKQAQKEVKKYFMSNNKETTLEIKSKN